MHLDNVSHITIVNFLGENLTLMAFPSHMAIGMHKESSPHDFTLFWQRYLSVPGDTNKENGTCH